MFCKGGVSFKKYKMKIKSKYDKIIGRLNTSDHMPNQEELEPVYYKNQHGFFDALYYSFQGMRYFFKMNVSLESTHRKTAIHVV